MPISPTPSAIRPTISSLGRSSSVGQQPHLARQPAGIGAEILPQAVSLAQHGAGMGEQRTSGGGRRDALPAAREQRRAERLFHFADAGRRCAERKICALGAALFERRTRKIKRWQKSPIQRIAHPSERSRRI